MFATVDDLVARWLNIPDDLPEPILEAKLEDATVWLQVKYPSLPENPDGKIVSVLKMVTCNMVKRSLANPDYEGLTSYSETAGQFTESITLSNTSGDNLYLTKQEQELIEGILFGTSTGTAGSFEARG